MRKINEDVTKSDVENIADRRFDSKMSSRDFEKRVREITAEVVEDLFKTLYYRSSSWKGGLK
jgi:hypothetical protein